MRKKLLLTLLAAAVVVSWWSYHESHKVTESAALDAEIRKTPEELEHKVFSFSIDGRSAQGARQWHLEGNSAEIIGEDIHLDELKAVVYSDEATVDLTSDSGVYSKSKGEVELIGNVHVVADVGFTLDTQKAQWSQDTREIRTDTVVEIKGQGMTAKGTGGMANADNKTARLDKDITVTIEPSTEVKCDGPMEVMYDDNKAVFHVNVKVTDKDGALFSDKMTVDLDPDEKKLQRVVAEGNVKLKRGNSYTMSEKAIYTESTKHAELIGKPRVIIDPGELADLAEDEGGSL